MSTFKRASAVLLNNSGSLYEKNYSLVLRINPRLNNNNSLNLINKRNNATGDKPKAEKAKAPPPKGISYKNLTVGVLKESFPNERRVAVTPAVTQALTKKGFTVLVEDNAGLSAKFPNDQYVQAGGKISDAKAISNTDILLKVRAPTVNEIRGLRDNINLYR